MSSVTYQIVAPAFPAYVGGKDVYANACYDAYLKKFREYANSVLELQVGMARRSWNCAEEIAKISASASSVDTVRECVDKVLSGIQESFVDQRKLWISQSSEVRDGVKELAGKIDGLKVEAVSQSEGSSAGIGHKAAVRGRHYEKNRRKKDRRRTGGSSGFESVFSGCDKTVKEQLVNSRAEMLVSENRARTAKAESQVRHLNMVKESGVAETKFEVSRQTVEDKLRCISEKRLGSGFVEGTIYSSAATPPLSCGSVSPNSSITMAEVKRKDNLIVTLETELAKAKVSMTEVKKKLDTALKIETDLRKRNQELETDNRRKNVESEWRDSVYE